MYNQLLCLFFFYPVFFLPYFYDFDHKVVFFLLLFNLLVGICLMSNCIITRLYWVSVIMLKLTPCWSPNLSFQKTKVISICVVLCSLCHPCTYNSFLLLPYNLLTFLNSTVEIPVLLCLISLRNIIPYLFQILKTTFVKTFLLKYS